MKKYCLFFVYLLLCMGMRAATVEVKTNLWSGIQAMDAAWSNWISIQASEFASAEVGNVLSVSISDTSTSEAQILLNTGKWSNMPGAEDGVMISDAPCEKRWTITEDMLAALKTNGLVVKGVSYTATSIDLIRQVQTSDAEKGNPVSAVWTGEKSIDWSAGVNSYHKLDAEAFVHVKVGDKIRFNYNNLSIGAQGHIATGDWKDMPDGTDYKQLSSSYFEYAVTADMLSKLQEGGCVVTGIGYVLTSVDVIDPTQIPTIVCQVDKNDIKCWEKGETPTIRVSMQSLESKEQNVIVKVVLRTDAYEDYDAYEQAVTLASGETQTVAVEMPNLKPGFYHAVVTANYTEVADFNIGYDPQNVPVKATTPTDFWSYWEDGLKELAATDADISMEELTDKSTDVRKIYLVTMKSVADSTGGTPVTIRGYYAEPVAEGKYPTLIHYQGTDGGSSTPWCMNADDNPGYCEFVLSTRGQMLNNREPNLADNVYGRDESTGKTDYYSYGWGDKEKHYYRGAYLDCVRAIDFVKSQAKVDADNLYAAGGSQGGCFTYVAEGLSGAFKAIAPSITGHADFEEGMRIVNWPRANFLAAADKLGMTTDEMNEFNSYFDVMNFSEHVTCPVISCFSLQDTTDPTRTNLAPFNLLDKVKAEDKVYIINPFLGHATPSDWGKKYMAFFEKYYTKDTPTTIKNVSSADSIKEHVYYDLGGGLRKIRMAVDSKGKGKAGGARVITYTTLVDEDTGDVWLVEIYDKSEYSTVKTDVIKKMLKGLGL